MRRISILFTLLFLLIALAKPILAAEDPKIPDPMKIITITGNEPGEVISIDQGIIPRFFKKAPDWVYQKLITIKYDNDQHSFVNALRGIGLHLDNVFTNPLMPQALKDEYNPPFAGEKLSTNLLFYDTGHRLCFSDEVRMPDQTVRKDIPLKGLNTSKTCLGCEDYGSDGNPTFFWHKALVASQLGVAYSVGQPNKGQASSLDYRTETSHLVPVSGETSYEGEPVLDVDIDDLDKHLYKCDYAVESKPKSYSSAPARGLAVSGSNGTGGFVIGEVVVNFLRSILGGKLRQCSEDDPDNECANSQLTDLPTNALSGQPAFESQMVGIAKSKLHDELDENIKQKIVADGGGDPKTGKGGGFLNTFWTKSDSLPALNQEVTAEIDQSYSMNGSPVTIKSKPRHIYSITSANDCVVDSMLLPKVLQNSCVLTDQPTNTSDWANSKWDGRPLNPRFNPPPPAQGSIQESVVNAAKSQGIPQCVLEGVTQIEGGYTWVPNDSRISECRPNSCSAAGPFQITIGQDANGNPSCPGCTGSTWVQKNGCPNTWGRDPESPCNYGHAAERAAQILKAKAGYQGYTLGPGDPRSQQEAIIAAGYGYYGSKAPIDRLGGCSYGEFVYQHCVPSYVCRSANYKPNPSR